MRINRRAVLAIVALFAPVPLGAQVLEQGGHAAFYVGNSVELLDAQPFMSQAVVADEAFSADAVTDFTQVLSDGNRIERHFSSAVARDGRGRTRREQEVALLGPLSSVQGEPPMLVTISDPVANTHYTLDARARIAFRSRIPAEMFRIATGKLAAASHAIARPFEAHAAADVLIEKGGGVSNVTTVQLGSRQIEGITAEGTRTTMTIPAGQIGNIAPIEIVTERWFSNELQEAVLITRRDPRSGETVYRLTNIVRAEPPADLFTIPPDYEVRDSNVMTKGLRFVTTPETTRKGVAGSRSK